MDFFNIEVSLNDPICTTDTAMSHNQNTPTYRNTWLFRSTIVPTASFLPISATD